MCAECSNTLLGVGRTSPGDETRTQKSKLGHIDSQQRTLTSFRPGFTRASGKRKWLKARSVPFTLQSLPLVFFRFSRIEKRKNQMIELLLYTYITDICNELIADTLFRTKKVIHQSFRFVTSNTLVSFHEAGVKGESVRGYTPALCAVGCEMACAGEGQTYQARRWW